MIDWTIERITGLSSPEVRQLRANAERLQNPEIAARCAEVLKDRPDHDIAVPKSAAQKKGIRFVSRNSAFGLRGATLASRFWSRSAVTRTGEIMFALWADDTRYDKKGASLLLWAPNVDGSRPWSDKP